MRSKRAVFTLLVTIFVVTAPVAAITPASTSLPDRSVSDETRPQHLSPVSNAEFQSASINVTDSNTTSVGENRSLAESFVTNQSQTIYEQLRSKSFNGSYWDKRAEDLSATVADNVADELRPTVENILVLIGSQFVGFAADVLTYTKVLVNIGILADSVKTAQVRQNLEGPESHEQIRENISNLQDNANRIENATSTKELRENFSDRKTRLEQLYQLLPEYLDGVRQNVLDNPTYNFTFETIGGGGLNLGRSAYTSIRWNTELLRHQLVIDYRATTMWLQNNSQGEHIAKNTSTEMPIHQLDYSNQVTRYYDTLDTGDDYAIYEIQVSEELASGEKNLGVRIGTTDPENVSAYMSRSKPTSITSPSGVEFERTSVSLRNNTVGISEGSYYVLVKTTNSTGLYYKFETSVYKPDLFPLIDLEHVGPTVNLQVTGEGGKVDSGSDSLPDHPVPKIVSVRTTPPESQLKPGDTVTVNVTVTNRGQNATWQTIAVSSPVHNDSSAITVLNASKRSTYTNSSWPNGVFSEYGTNKTNVSYPLAEGAWRNWSYQENRYLTVEIELPEDLDQPLPIYVKSVARGSGQFTSDPGLGTTAVTDQQEEFVQVERIGDSWPMVARNPQHTGYNPFEKRNTTNLIVRESWNVTNTKTAPVLREEKVYFGKSHKYWVVDSLSGEILQKRGVGLNQQQNTPSIGYGSVFMTGDDSDSKFSIKAKGNSNFANRFGRESLGSPPIIANGFIYISRPDNDLITALDVDTGNKVIDANTKSTIKANPTIYNGSIYVTDITGRLYSFNSVTGGELWNTSIGNYSTSTPTAAHGLIYAGSDEGLTAVDAVSGKEIWKFSTKANVSSSVAVDRDTVYFGADDGYFYALNATTGSLRWKILTATLGTEQPAVIDGVVYFGSDDHFVYALNSTNGQRIWRFQADGSISRVAVVDHHIYFRTDQRTVYALEEIKGGSLSPAEAGIRADNSGGPPSKNKTFEISLIDASEVAGFQANLTYDPSVIEVVTVSGRDFGSIHFDVNNKAGYTTLAQSNSSKIGIRNPIVAEVTVNVTGSVSATSQLEFNRKWTKVSSIDGVESTPTIRSGTFTVYPQGDVNHDGTTAIGDAVLVKREIAKLQINGTFDQAAADMSDDNVIDVRDAVRLQQKIVNVSTSTSSSSEAETKSSGSSLNSSSGSSTDLYIEETDRENRTVNVTIRVENATSVAGYQVNVSINRSSVEEVTLQDSDFDSVVINRNETQNWIILTDAQATGLTDPILANLTITLTFGNADTNLSFNQNETLLSDTSGEEIPASLHGEKIQIELETIGPADSRPTDPDRDGIYEDLNGNGRLDFKDIVLFFENQSDAAIQDNTAAFDFNQNGRIDFDDIVTLFNEI